MKLAHALVTGGAGFIGSHVCEALSARGVRTRVLDDLSVGSFENVPKGVECVVGDVRDPVAVRAAMDGVDGVFHLAAKVSIRASVQTSVEDCSVNVIGTLQVLRAAALASVSKIVLASSMAVYGGATRTPQDEDHFTQPNSPYGIGKLTAERYALLMAELEGFDAVCLRYFNTYGIRQAPTPYVGVMSIFIRRLLAGKSPEIFGDGEQRRDFIYVSDVAEATVRAMECDISGVSINVGTGEGTSINRLVGLLQQRIAPQVPIRHVAAPAAEVRDSIADVKRLKTLLGLQATTGIEANIDEVIAFIQAQV